MANQTDVQKLIQSLTPSAVNNGNPNTVYNTAPVNHSGWTPGTVSPAATLPPLSLPPIDPRLTAWVPPAGTSPGIQGPILPTMPPMGPPVGGGGGGAGGTPPPVSPPVVEPPVQPPGGGGGGGIPYDPTLTDLVGGLPPSTRGSGDYGWGTPIYGPGPQGGVGAPGGGGSFDWKQMLDAISEPFLPGDHYLENTGKISGLNIGKGLLDTLLGPGAGWLGDKAFGAFGGDAYFNEILKLAENSMQGNANEVAADTKARVAANIERTLDEMFGKNTSAGGREGNSSQAAGATTIATGPAAQQMVADMQLQYSIERARQQARKAMNPFYKSEW